MSSDQEGPQKVFKQTWAVELTAHVFITRVYPSSWLLSLAWIPMKEEKPNGFSVQHGQKASFDQLYVNFL
jgi:hypothetical protein